MLASFNEVSLVLLEFVHAVAERTLPLAVLLMSVCSHSGYENLEVLLYITYNYQCELSLKALTESFMLLLITIWASR